MQRTTHDERSRSTTTQRRVVVTRRGGPEVMDVVVDDVPQPGTGEVRVRVLAAGVSAFDVMLRAHWFPGFPRVPFTPGVDVVGVVDAVGAHVTSVDVGQTVAAGAFATQGGGYAEHLCLPADQAVPVPDGVDPAAAVCLVANYLTAHSALHRTAGVRGGERILVQGAAGGVGSALLQLGALAGLELYGTASGHNHAFVSSLGATPIDYRTEDVVARVRSLTGDGVDAVFDPVGGARQLWRSYRCLREGGRLVWFGVAATSRAGMRIIPESLLTRLILSLLPDGRHAPLPADAGEPTTWYRATLTELLDLLAAGTLAPPVAARIPLIDAARAHERLERGGNAGKIVLVTDAYGADRTTAT
jgi:NADPH:quinone reductase-like Zn-dependent oxidoreductase